MGLESAEVGEVKLSEKTKIDTLELLVALLRQEIDELKERVQTLEYRAIHPGKE